MNDENKFYSVNEIMKLIETQFKLIIQQDYEYYKKYNIKLANEQYYIPPEERKEQNTIFIVVKFLPADISYNQNIVPFTINAVSEYNSIEVCQKILLEYAQTYNLIDDETINGVSYNQTYTTPQTISSFTEMFYGYRSILIMSGTFLLSKNINSSKLYYINENGEEELVEAITFHDDFSIQLDTQGIYNNFNRTKSEARVGTYAINFSMKLVNNEICNKILAIVCKKESVNTNFRFRIKYRYDENIVFEDNFKLFSYSRSQDIGNMPFFSASFTN